MALVHDMAEAIVGDITPYCGVSVEEKRKMEEVQLLHIVCFFSFDSAIISGCHANHF